MKRTGVAAFALGLFLGYCPISAQDQSRPGGSTQNSLQLTLLTYNMCAHCGQDIQKKLAFVAQEIKGLSPDIIALQEVKSDWLNSILGTLGEGKYKYIYHEECCNGYPGRLIARNYSGLAILSRFPIIQDGKFQLPHKSDVAADHKLVPKWALTMHHWLIMAEIQTSIGLLKIFTTHLTPNGLESAARNDQISAITKKLSENLSTNPQIMMGDFNKDFDMKAKNETPPVLDPNWVDTYKAANPDADPASGYTWDRDKDEQAAKQLANGQWSDWQSGRFRIDYICVVPASDTGIKVKVLESRIVLTETYQNGIHPSDHFGVLSKIEITRERNVAQVIPIALPFFPVM